MKKTLVALAVLGSFAGAASAATSVTLYGTVDAGYEDWSGKGDYKGDKAPFNSKFVQGGTTEGNSKIGLKGQEDLGNGLAAVFKLEGEIWGDTGESDLFNKETTVGLKGNFGEVKFGRAKSQMDLALGGIVPGARVADLDLYSVASTRHANGMFYSYDNAGFSFGADVTTKGGALDKAGVSKEGEKDSKIGYGVRAGWTGNVGGNVTLLARLAHQNDGKYGNGNKTARETGGLLAVVVPYSNNALTVGVAYAQGRGLASDLAHEKFASSTVTTIATDKARTLSAVVASTFGPNDSAYVKYQDRKGKTNGATDYKGNVWAIGYSHSLSKRTSVYADAAYAKIKNRKGVDMNGKAVGYSVGLAHNF